jgi:uncharacterized membrane protein
MTGPALAAAAGLGFGVFQTLNRRAVGGMADAYLATFLQLLIALGVLVVASVTTEDVGLLGEATTASLIWFGAAGLVHFFVGWTLLNMSQMRIGAARTSPLLSTNPVFGAAIAAVWLSEFPSFFSWIGILLVLAGAFVVSLERVAETGWGVDWRDAAPGLATALAWSISPFSSRRGSTDSSLRCSGSPSGCWSRFSSTPQRCRSARAPRGRRSAPGTLSPSSSSRA